MEKNLIQDDVERKRALDPRQSFIVQAPAGSGKTELLTQRFLVLLSHVSAPEEVLAITFTKKAAAEMRARVIKTLKKASIEPEPLAAHEKQTWLLARRALQQNEQLNWHLLENPNRLRIQTIDSFSASLIKHLPILSHFGAPPEITENAKPLYREAVQEFLSLLEDNMQWSDAIAQLLTHMDNNSQKVEALLISLLEKRDQWMRHLAKNPDVEVLRKVLESNLAEVVTEALAFVTESFPPEHTQELVALARLAAENLRVANDIETKITYCQDLTALPSKTLADKNAWLGIKELLFTKECTWRKTVNANTGFPAQASGKNAAEKKQLKDDKDRICQLLAALNTNEKLLAAFTALHYAPSDTYPENQWQALKAIHEALIIAVAVLKVVFKQHGKIDYIENSLAALQALGSDEAPTDLALALDYQIKHILIDEFQDTSNSQFALIKKLTEEWQADDGRTLFVVGDPMQSIYRFREADVAIFIRARREGIGQVKLEPLTLSVNFRSTSVIVDWVNDHFNLVLPEYDDVASGAVSYSHSKANQRDADVYSLVVPHVIVDTEKTAQAQAVVQLILKLRQEKPTDTITILVRARTHLKDIIPELKKAKLNYRAIKIDPLDSRAIIQDLMALTRALINPADRVAWLAILRAPWCGLSLSDLLLLGGMHPKKTLWESLTNPKLQGALSNDATSRLNRVMPILKIKTAERQRFSLRAWVESTWLLIGGPACMTQESDLEDVNAYFNLLEKLDNGGELADFNNLENDVSNLFAAPDNTADNNLQIMTIHNAKGLEFDTVILPHLEKQSPNDDKQLLLWMERSRDNADSALILTPVHAIGEKNDSIYDFIKKQHATKADHETGRLLYVAATRAKSQLHLFLTPKIDAEDEFSEPTGKSLLQKLWPSIKAEVAHELTTNSEKPARASNTRAIKRLISDWENPIQEIPADVITKHQKAPGFQLSQDNPKRLGTLVHKILENIAQLGKNWWCDKTLEKREFFINRQLLQAGVLTTEIAKASRFVSQCINNTLEDARGQWILDPHLEAQTEAPLTAIIDDEQKHLIIDRTFIDDNDTRWIIDYKTAHFEGDNLENFLRREQEEYQEQMSHYLKALSFLDKRPIKLGLYFPAIPAWKEWENAENLREISCN
jgi:ATP-dependent helicase/nuclease subunit A